MYKTQLKIPFLHTKKVPNQDPRKPQISKMGKKKKNKEKHTIYRHTENQQHHPPHTHTHIPNKKVNAQNRRNRSQSSKL